MATLAPLFLMGSFLLFIRAGDEDNHKSSDEFEFRPERTTDWEVGCS